MAFLRPQKRHVPKPDLVGPHQSTNPMFEEATDWSAFRTRVVGYTALALTVTAIGFLIYGPWFSVETVSVSGTRLIDPKSIEQSAKKYLDGQRWLVLPNRTIWILSSRGLAQHLEKQIRQRISIDQVTVEKTIPHHLKIVIAERTPVATWTNGTVFGSVDKNGKIIEMQTSPDTNLPLVRDENAQIFTVDSSVVKQVVIAGLHELAGQLKTANIQVNEFLIPIPVCPAPIIPATDSNTNSATNSSSTNINSNLANINSNVVTNSSSATNTTLLQNVNQGIQVAPVCDREALRYASQEIHVRLAEDGPRVLFDRHSNLKQAVQALQRVLSERTSKPYSSIDVRFGDRVYVQ